ncbi:unnamed protein product, partial [Cuscuta epithymum]
MEKEKRIRYCMLFFFQCPEQVINFKSSLYPGWKMASFVCCFILLYQNCFVLLHCVSLCCIIIVSFCCIVFLFVVSRLFHFVALCFFLLYRIVFFCSVLLIVVYCKFY